MRKLSVEPHANDPFCETYLNRVTKVYKQRNIGWAELRSKERDRKSVSPRVDIPNF